MAKSCHWYILGELRGREDILSSLHSLRTNISLRYTNIEHNGKKTKSAHLTFNTYDIHTSVIKERIHECIPTDQNMLILSHEHAVYVRGSKWKKRLTCLMWVISLRSFTVPCQGKRQRLYY